MPEAKKAERLVDKAVDLVDRDRLVALTVALTDIASPTGQEGEVARAYADILEQAGLSTKLQPIGDERYNAVGRLEGAGSGRSLLFNGHLDTSFGNEFADRGPGFRAAGSVVDDEWIFGMGTFNMKNALAAYVVAAEAIHGAGIRLIGDLLIAGVAGEIEKAPCGEFVAQEYQGYGVGSKHLVTHGGVADACILGEPTNMKLVPAHCGSSWLKIEIPGKLVHTAWARHEDNAIMKAGKVLDALDAWIPTYRERNAIGNFQPKVNIAAIDGGWAWRGARSPDNCSIYVDARTVPDAQPTAILNELRDVVAEVNEANPDVGARVEMYVSNPGTSIPVEHDLVRSIQAAHADQLGRPPEMS
ncbi:MAG: M20/M25/M40 family metallo-hydrolase, partial [Gammaproteobacteria bacterium]|nr:M20/M25/M40 family metallo-hydrolase [Gammaproteobacteria bacterium]